MCDDSYIGVSIAGYIEVRSDQTAPDFGWRAAIDLDVLTWGNDKISSVPPELFGVDNSHKAVTGQAPMRGLPHDVSEAVRAASELDSARSDAAFGGPSWIAWPEIAHAQSEESPERSAHWKRILAVLSLLAGVYGDENVRLIAWLW